MTVVLDASALIALLRNERGADVVAGQAQGALISTVNMAEVLQRMATVGMSAEDVLRQQVRLEVEVVPFSLFQARRAAGLRLPSRRKGLGLGDRACLALALDRGVPVLTGDQTWLEVETGAEVRLFRERGKP